MTNTKVSAKSSDLRREWVEELIAQITSADTPLDTYLAILNRLRREGPNLARPDYERWQRRFRWIDLQLERNVNVREVVARSLTDLYSVVRYPR